MRGVLQVSRAFELEFVRVIGDSRSANLQNMAAAAAAEATVAAAPSEQVQQVAS